MESKLLGSNTGIGDSQENIIVGQKQLLNILEIYITELFCQRFLTKWYQARKARSQTQEEADANEKSPYILQSEMEKTTKEMRDEKATGDENVSGDILNLLGEDGLRIFAQLINNMYETGQWPKNFTEVRMTALKRQPKAKLHN